ncbi:MAG: hypothetical protein KDJ47_03695 [Hyphomicrobiaceae bacterium]|nr:hypothetical protein [Hyphomicrobiaceae bacterium]
MTGKQLHDALQDEVSRDALRDLINATRKPQQRTIGKLERAIGALREQLIIQKLLPADAPLTTFKIYNSQTPLLVVKKPLSLDEQVIDTKQRERINDTVVGTYDLYRRESGPTAYVRDKLILHKLFRNQFPVTLVSHVPDGQAPNSDNVRVYRGYSYINNTTISAFVGCCDETRRFDLGSVLLRRTQSMSTTTMGGILTGLTTSQGTPMATPIVVCRTNSNGIDLEFPEFWNSHLEALIASHNFIASDLKARQKKLLGDKRETLIAQSATDIENEFGVLCS